MSNLDPHSDAGSRPQSRRIGATNFARRTGTTPSKRKKFLWIGLGSLAVALPVGAVLLATFSSTVSNKVQAVKSGGLFGSETTSAGNTAKPPAGKPLTQEPATPPPIYAPRSRMPSVPQNSGTLEIPPGPAVPPTNGVTPPQPGVPVPTQPGVVPAPVAAAPFAPVVYPARHDKVFGSGCSGQLSLNGNGLQFTCPDNAHDSLQFPMGDIAAVDDNGVRLSSGKKFHFSITGMSKGSEVQLFTNWFNSSRMSGFPAPR